MYRQKSYSRGRSFSRGGGGNRGGRMGFNRSFDPRTVIGQSTSPTSVGPEAVKNKFADFVLDTRLAQNIARHNFAAPTPIQDQAIPEILAGRDVAGFANTGTGKTAAFLIPLINKVCLNNKSQVLIIAPTRELAVQIDDELYSFSKGLNIFSTTCIGGVPIRAQIHKLRRGVNFVIGTPGRLLDLENQRQLDFSQFDSIVLDEVDRMLDMGFIDDINRIISKLPTNRQSLFFSATLGEKARSVMRKFSPNPVMISVKTADYSTNVHQDVVELKGRSKTDVLREILRQQEVTKTLIFMRTKHGADALHKDLTISGFQSTVLHGNKSQGQRQKSLNRFRQGNVNILIATDVASRGIDVDDISHVINHDLPESYDAYIHRIGRTGRANKKGIALTLVG